MGSFGSTVKIALFNNLSPGGNDPRAEHSNPG